MRKVADSRLVSSVSDDGFKGRGGAGIFRDLISERIHLETRLEWESSRGGDRKVVWARWPSD